MTIPNTARKAGPLLGTGSQTAWPFTFKVFAAGDVQVTIANSAGTETLLVLGTDYSVTLNSNQDTSPGGTVNYPLSGSALPVGSVLAIIGDLDYDQPLDLPSGGNFSPTALENQLDRSTMQIQQLREEMNRTAKLPPTSSESVEALVDDLQRIADSADNLDTVADNIADINTVASDLNEPVSEINTVAGSIANVNTVGNNITNVNTVAGISANVTTVAGIAANVTAVAGNATNINAVAGNATNINAVNANKTNIDAVAANQADIDAVAANQVNINAVAANETNIDTVAGIAANVTAVAGNATNINAVAANEAAIDTVAGISAAVSAVAAIDDDVTIAAANVADITNFADVYQGPKASDPTLRNDGSALQAGDLYFNTTDDALRAYSGTAWVAGTAGTLSVQNFSGNGSTTAFTLAAAPAGENNTQVYIGGVYQQKDQYSVSGTTLTFSSAPTSGTNNIEVVTISTLALGETDASLVTFLPAGTGAVERTAQVKLRERVSVKDFGAAGDGVADDTAEVQAAIDAVNANGGGVLFFPVGIYKLTSTITLKPGVSIIGEQKGEWGSPGTPGVVFRKAFISGSVLYSPNTQTIASVTFENFYIEGNKGGIGGSNGNGLEIQKGHDIIVRRVWAHECPSSGFVIGQGSASYHNYFYNCYASFNGGSGYVVQSDWMRFIDCWADGNYIGIDFPNSAYCGGKATVERCHFEEWELAAVAVRGNSVIGGNGENKVLNSVFYSRPYDNSWPAHGIFLDGGSSGSGASGNQIKGNKMVYQSNYGPAKTGRYGVYCYGGAGGSNIIEDNQIGGFDLGIAIASGSIRNTVRGNSVDGCNTAISNGGANTTISENVCLANTADLSSSGGSAIVVGNLFSVDPTLAATDYAAANRNAYGLSPASGVQFPATQIASSDPNTLDDYEEGTWTPTQGGGLTVVGTFSSSGTYTKVGRTVTVHGRLTGSTSVAVNAGGLMCAGLPFSTGSFPGIGTMTNANASQGGVFQLSVVTIYAASSIAATSNIYFTCTYEV